MYAIINGTLLTITQGRIPQGRLLINKGKIIAIGDDTLEIPSQATVIDATASYVTPGLIEAHGHLCGWGEPRLPATSDDNEMSGPIQAQLRALDYINPRDPAIPLVRNAGITTVFTCPGSGNLIGGTGIAIKLRGKTAEEMIIPGSEAMKMALGENPKRSYGNRKQAPMTRMGNAAVLRKALIKAQNYPRKIKQAQEQGSPLPDRDLGLEALGQLLNGKLTARIHVHRADDMITAIRLAEEFNFPFILEHATEGYLIKEILAEKKVRCVVGPNMLPPSKQEVWQTRPDNAAMLQKAGVTIACTVDAGSETRWLPLHAGVLVRFGLPEDEALKAITINPAQMLGLADRLGSLEVGKDADIAIFNGFPLHTYTSAQAVFIEGELVYQQNV